MSYSQCKFIVFISYFFIFLTVCLSRDFDTEIKKNKLLLKKTKKTTTLKYIAVYDDLAKLIILRNRNLIYGGRDDEINTDNICNFVEKYKEVEFLKTQFYKTPFCNEVAITLSNIAKLYQNCYPPLAKKQYKIIITINKNLYGKKSEQYAQSLDELADYLRIYMFRLSDAINYYSESRKIREKLYDTDDFRVTKNYARLGLSLFYHKSDKKGAELLILKSLKIRKKDKNTPENMIVEALADARNFYMLIGDFKKAKMYESKDK